MGGFHDLITANKVSSLPPARTVQILVCHFPLHSRGGMGGGGWLMSFEFRIIFTHIRVVSSNPGWAGVALKVFSLINVLVSRWIENCERVEAALAGNSCSAD